MRPLILEIFLTNFVDKSITVTARKQRLECSIDEI